MELGGRLAYCLKCRGLHPDLCDNDKLPCLFEHGRLCVPLRPHARALRVISLKRKQNRARRMVRSTQNNRRAAIGQFRQQ